ncbi:MAG: ankyrin repeat domain-containing protein [Acidobacteriaceae bacterium]
MNDSTESPNLNLWEQPGWRSRLLIFIQIVVSSLYLQWIFLRYIRLRLRFFVRGRAFGWIHFKPESFQDESARRFARAVAEGRVSTALHLASALPAGVNTIAPDGVTALLLAINHLDKRMVRALLEAGANPNGAQELAPLALAISLKKLSLAQILLESGADPNGRMQSKSALCLAAFSGNLQAAELLLQYHADPDLGDEFNAPPAFEAALKQNWRFVLRMLNSGASLWTVDTHGITLGYWAHKSRINPAGLEGHAHAQVVSRLKAAEFPWPPPSPKEVARLRDQGQWPPTQMQ